jgi:hypothetical protein
MINSGQYHIIRVHTRPNDCDIRLFFPHVFPLFTLRFYPTILPYDRFRNRVNLLLLKDRPKRVHLYLLDIKTAADIDRALKLSYNKKTKSWFLTLVLSIAGRETVVNGTALIPWNEPAIEQQ